MYMTAAIRKQSGFTLVEMLVASVLGLFVTAVIITVFSTNVRTNTENLKMIRLNQELRAVMTFMTDELKRHGYSSDPNNTDFMDNFNYDAGSNCLRYSYDEDGNSVRSGKERLAFQLTADAIRWGTSVTTNNCSNGNWESVTITDIAQINTLAVDLSGSANSSGATGTTAVTTTTGVSVYDIGLTLVGQIQLPHTAMPAKRTIIETVRVRNEAPKE